MSDKKARVPQIRFAGFTVVWKEHSFSEITYLAGEKNRDNLPYQSFSISNQKGFVPQEEQFENGGTMKEADKSMYLIVQPNSFAYNPARINVGSIGYYDLPENVIVSSLYEVFKTSNDLDDRFLWHWFKSGFFPKLIERYQEGGVRLYFYYNKLCMCTLVLPDIEEQRKIGKYFDNLDNLITLQQRQVDKLDIVKKTMLEKMFPKDGANVPEIRFAGFTGAWEERKLGELGTLKNGMNFSKEAMGIGFPFVNLQNIFGKNIIDTENLGMAEANQKQLKDYNLLEGDVLFVRSSVKLEGVGEAAIISETLVNTTYSGFIIRFRDEHGMEKNFKRYIFSTRAIRKQIIAQATDSANKNISQPVLSNLDISLPSYEEQKQIGTFFSNLDNLITLHQRELNTLNTLKKSMLQQLFV